MSRTVHKALKNLLTFLVYHFACSSLSRHDHPQPDRAL